MWRRGLEVFARGSVGTPQYDPEQEVWSAKVQGSATDPYRVWVYFEPATQGATRRELDGDCDCQAPKPCKHIAALAMAVQHRTPPRADPEVPVLRPAPAASRRAFTQWAQDLASAAATTTAEPVEAATPTHPVMLVFAVRPVRDGAGQRRVAIETHAATTIGGRTSTSPYDLDAALATKPEARAPWLRDVDLAMWVRLQACERRRAAPGQRLLPHDAHGAHLLAEVVALGVAREGDADGPPLHPGEPRAARLRWRLDADAHQQLVVEPADDAAPPWRILPMAPLHYVDADTGACGPVALEIPAAEQIRLLDVPGVDPTWSGALSRTLRTTLLEGGVPLPRALAIGRARRGQPVPVLRLFARVRGELREPCASLSFDYEGTEIGLADTRPTVVRIEGDRVDRLTRDNEAERWAQERLAGEGLVGDPDAMGMLDGAKWFAFARGGAPQLRQEGWRVEIGPDFEWNTTLVDSWYAEGHDGAGAEAPDAPEGGGAWFLELGVVVDGERVNILPAVVAAIRSGQLAPERLRLGGQPLVVALPDGRRVEVDAARLQAIVDVLVELHDERRMHDGKLVLARLDAPRLQSLGDFAWTLDPKLQAFADRLARGPDALPPPTGLVATLREYQLHGMAWLQWLREGGLGGILADDMGLGKTIQALAHLLIEKEAGRLTRPALVVAPRSVLGNWLREAERFTPGLRATAYHGAERGGVLDALDRWDVVVTTYALLQRDAALGQPRWHVAILDEAQMMKNPTAKVAVAARALHADQRICMTGTPVENNLRDLWSLMAFANPGLLGTSRQFTTWYRTPIEKHGEVGRFDALTQRIAPFLLRRTKAQVLAELPPKTEIVLHATLEGPQRDLYESVRMSMEKRVREELARRGLARSRIVVLDALLKLRQVCCDPELLALRGRAPDSAKLALLLELVDELVAEGRRALVFSQFTTMLSRIERELDARRIPWLSITGKTNDRQTIVDRFQTGAVPILLVSLKAGGTGLNLTAADTVIHYDPWWNPAVEAQATDRAHRIGQSQPVTVYRLICDGTVEERMLALQARKSALVRGVHESAERRANLGLALGTDEIAALLAPIDPEDRVVSTVPAVRGARANVRGR